MVLDFASRCTIKQIHLVTERVVFPPGNEVAQVAGL